MSVSLKVEMEPGQLVPDFSHSVLLHRSIIEQLNSQIKVQYICVIILTDITIIIIILIRLLEKPS